MSLYFAAAKNAYVAARKNERQKIREALKSAGFEVKTSGNAGAGLRNYTSGRRLDLLRFVPADR